MIDEALVMSRVGCYGFGHKCLISFLYSCFMKLGLGCWPLNYSVYSVRVYHMWLTNNWCCLSFCFAITCFLYFMTDFICNIFYDPWILYQFHYGIHFWKHWVHLCMGLLPDTQNCECACAGNAGNVFPVTAGKRSRHASRHVRHARAVMHAGVAI